jgi:hypothetical protein
MVPAAKQVRVNALANSVNAAAAWAHVLGVSGFPCAMRHIMQSLIGQFTAAGKHT